MALEAIQAQAGHVSIETTRIYLHLVGAIRATACTHWVLGIGRPHLGDPP